MKSKWNEYKKEHENFRQREERCEKGTGKRMETKEVKCLELKEEEKKTSRKED